MLLVHIRAVSEEVFICALGSVTEGSDNGFTGIEPAYMIALDRCVGEASWESQSAYSKRIVSILSAYLQFKVGGGDKRTRPCKVKESDRLSQFPLPKGVRMSTVPYKGTYWG
jgi:hypothetical protein